MRKPFEFVTLIEDFLLLTVHHPVILLREPLSLAIRRDYSTTKSRKNPFRDSNWEPSVGSLDGFELTNGIFSYRL
jgi:hypothetical protein